jgi:hypothetical protein
MTKKEWFLLLSGAMLVGMLLYRFICQDFIKCEVLGGTVIHTVSGHECMPLKRLQ